MAELFLDPTSLSTPVEVGEQLELPDELIPLGSDRSVVGRRVSLALRKDRHLAQFLFGISRENRASVSEGIRLDDGPGMGAKAFDLLVLTDEMSKLLVLAQADQLASQRVPSFGH